MMIAVLLECFSHSFFSKVKSNDDVLLILILMLHFFFVRNARLKTKQRVIHYISICTLGTDVLVQTWHLQIEKRSSRAHTK